MDYKKSVELALNLGYEKIIDKYAYKGVYYIKNDKIWIHNIDALKLKVKVNSNEELELLGYDVQNYHKFSKYTNNMVDKFMKDLYVSITHSEGEATYLHDGMWLLPNGKMEER